MSLVPFLNFRIADNDSCVLCKTERNHNELRVYGIVVVRNLVLKSKFVGDVALREEGEVLGVVLL